jgi:hypothetical protein
LFFELSNSLNNLKDISEINTEFTNYTIQSFDMILDGGNDCYLTFVVTKPQEEEYASTLMLNQIEYPESLIRGSFSWTLREQYKY